MAGAKAAAGLGAKAVRLKCTTRAGAARQSSAARVDLGMLGQASQGQPTCGGRNSGEKIFILIKSMRKLWEELSAAQVDVPRASRQRWAPGPPGGAGCERDGGAGMAGEANGSHRGSEGSGAAWSCTGGAAVDCLPYPAA